MLVFEAQQWTTVNANRGISVNDRLARLEANPKRAAALSRARARLGGVVEQTNGARSSLATMRLKAGLSQAQLAQMVGTQQGNVSRWERDPADLRATTIMKLATALKVDPAEILKAVSISSEVVGEV